jgi:glutamate 5-kinase
LLDDQKQIIPFVEQIDEKILGFVDTDKSALGLGGMVSKLNYTRLATRMGIKVVIFGMNKPDGIIEAVAEKIGTVFAPQEASLTARQKWLGSGSIIAGNVVVDAGAVEALNKRKSLLAVGITAVDGEFERGEVFEILDQSTHVIAIARARESSVVIAQNLKTQNFEVANADEIVLL